jgi:hypothetical protein
VTIASLALFETERQRQRGAAQFFEPDVLVGAATQDSLDYALESGNLASG